MSMQKYEPEEFARARYWQQQYLELERNFQKKLEEADFLAQRLKDHRKEMEIFNLLPWYERLFHKFDLDNL